MCHFFLPLKLVAFKAKINVCAKNLHEFFFTTYSFRLEENLYVDC